MIGWLHLEKLRNEPGDNLMSKLIEASEVASGSTSRVAGIAGLVLAAGFETTVNLLGNGIRLLLNSPTNARC